MFIANNVLLVSEYQKGIGIYDVRNLSAPSRVASITLDGNADMAISGTTLYCDSYRDLVVFDFSNSKMPAKVNTIKDVFDYYNPPTQTPSSGGGVSGCASCSRSETVYEPSSQFSSTRQFAKAREAGSASRFCVVRNYLYCVDHSNLVVFNIIDPKNPEFVARIDLGIGIETIYPYNNHVFIGSQTGMFVYNIDDIKIPKRVSQFTHARACDPVFVEDSIAYITLRNGGRCGWSDNALRVVSVRNILSPTELGATSWNILSGPRGVVVEMKTAFVCDGAGGVKILDTHNPKNISIIGQVPGIDVFDIIKRGNTLYVIGPSGIYLFDVSDASKPVAIATIKNPV